MVATAAGCWRSGELPCWQSFGLAPADGSRKRWCHAPAWCHAAYGVHVPHTSPAAPRRVPLSWESFARFFVAPPVCGMKGNRRAKPCRRRGAGAAASVRGEALDAHALSKGCTVRDQGGAVGWRWMVGVGSRWPHQLFERFISRTAEGSLSVRFKCGQARGSSKRAECGGGGWWLATAGRRAGPLHRAHGRDRGPLDLSLTASNGMAGMCDVVRASLTGG